MSRDSKTPVRTIAPDAIYSNGVVAKFINRMMKDGKKSISTKILYTAMQKIEEKSGEKALDVFLKAVDNVNQGRQA